MALEDFLDAADDPRAFTGVVLESEESTPIEPALSDEPTNGAPPAVDPIPPPVDVFRPEDLQSIRSAPCRIHDIIIEGAKRTKPHVIERELEEARKAGNFTELAERLVEATERLRGLDIFQKCVVTCEAGPSELPGTTNVVVSVVEKGLFGVRAGTYFQGREGSVEGSVSMRNAFGHAEQLDASVQRSREQSNTFSLGLAVPRPALRARVFQSNSNWQDLSSYIERLRGCQVGTDAGAHEVDYQLAWRELRDPAGKAGRSVRRQLGHSLLSSITHTYRLENRDSRLRPTEGWGLRVTSQLAGIGLDANLVRFIKEEVEAHVAFPLGFAGAALGLSATAGFLLPLGLGFGGVNKPTSISDRFFLGGPNSLRGFKHRGVGPSEPRRILEEPKPGAPPPPRDALGGDFVLSGVAALSFDLPVQLLRVLNIHGHVFVSAGNSVLVHGGQPKFSAGDFLRGSRASAGVGIVYPSPIGRLEINYCRPLRIQPGDNAQAFQIGFNVSSP